MLAWLGRLVLAGALLLPAISLAQGGPQRVSLSRCRELFATWERDIAAAKALMALDPEASARRVAELESSAGGCLRALQNDLRVLEQMREVWESRPDGAQAVQARVQQVARNLERVAAPQWQQPSLTGEAIGAAVDYTSPKEYLQDAGAVVTKWSDLAPLFAPVVDDLVSTLKPRVGLAVNVRECRALWLTDPRVSEEILFASTTGLAPVERIGFCLTALLNDLEVLDAHLRSLATQPKNVEVSDITDWQEPSLHGAAIGTVQSIEVDIDKYLIDASLVHEAKGRDRWQQAARQVTPGLGDRVRALMEFRSMRQLVSLLFTAEMVLLDMRRDGDRDMFQAEDAKAKTFPTATLLIESEHFYADSSPRPHFSFGGALGALPVLNLLKRQPPELNDSSGDSQASLPMALENEEIFPTFQQGFAWELNGKLHSNLLSRLEVSGQVYLGQSVLLNDKSLIERDADFVGIPLSNDTGRAELFYGWLVEARTFDLDLNIIHGEQSYLNPRFSIAFGERWNDRFVPEIGSSTASDQWMKSKLFRFRWNIRNTLVSRDKYQGPLLVTFTFGVEREWWPDGTGLPTVTSVFFSGDFDLNKIIKKKE